MEKPPQNRDDGKKRKGGKMAGSAGGGRVWMIGLFFTFGGRLLEGKGM